MVIAARWENSIGVVDNANPVASEFGLEPAEDLWGRIGALVVNRHDLIKVRQVASDGQLKEIRTILNTHKGADARRAVGYSKIGSTKAISCHFGSLGFEAASRHGNSRVDVCWGLFRLFPYKS
jgi:hypothetical protein